MEEVKKPILSVSYLCEHGVETHLARQPFLKCGERHEPLIKRAGVYSVKAQIVHEVKGTIESCVRAEETQMSCIRVDGLIHKTHKSHAYELKDCRTRQKSCVRAEDSQKLTKVMRTS